MGPVRGPSRKSPQPLLFQGKQCHSPGAFQGLIGETKCKQDPDAGAGGGSGTQGLAAPTARLSAAWPCTLQVPPAGMQRG